MWVGSLSGEDPWRRKWQPTPVVLLGKCHGQRSLVGTVRGIAKSQTRLKQLSTQLYSSLILSPADLHNFSVLEKGNSIPIE